MISEEVPERMIEFLGKLKEIIKEIESYEEGDTGDAPGYFVDENMDDFLEEIRDLCKKYTWENRNK